MSQILEIDVLKEFIQEYRNSNDRKDKADLRKRITHVYNLMKAAGGIKGRGLRCKLNRKDYGLAKTIASLQRKKKMSILRNKTLPDSIGVGTVMPNTNIKEGPFFRDFIRERFPGEQLEYALFFADDMFSKNDLLTRGINDNWIRIRPDKIGEAEKLANKIKKLIPDIPVSIEEKSSHSNKMNKTKTAPGIVNTVVDLSYRTEKFRIRRWLLEQTSHFNSIRALTLPGSEWLLERDMLITGKPEFIIGLEADKKMYEYSKLNIPYTDKAYLLNLKERDYINEDNKPADNKRFNFVWLDYMGQFVSNKLDAITNLFKYRFIDDEAIVTFTFINGLRDYTQIYKAYGGELDENGTYNTARIVTIPKILNDYAGQYGYRLAILKSEHYCEKQGNLRFAPMVFFAFNSRYIGEKQTLSISPTEYVTPIVKAKVNKPSVSVNAYQLVIDKKFDELKTLGFSKMQIAAYKANITKGRMPECLMKQL